METHNKRRADHCFSTPSDQEGQRQKHQCTKTTTDKVTIKEIKDCIEPVIEQVQSCPETIKSFIDEINERHREIEEGVKGKVVLGLLGRSGAGKSSLINAILGIPDLLLSASVSACTSVITKVVANDSPVSRYDVEIDFLSKEEWEEDLLELLKVISDDEKDNADEKDRLNLAKSKIQALYGDDGFEKNLYELLDIPTLHECFSSPKKKLSFEKVSDLSASISKYIGSKRRAGDAMTHGTTFYWPIVKSVTIKVPNIPGFMEHIELVDIPGAGDWNKTRDEMWKSNLSTFSAVWIVTELNRAGSEKEAWTILDESIRILGPGGECHRISFICTKTDQISHSDWRDEDLDTEGQDISTLKPQEIKHMKKRAGILRRNKEAKKTIKELLKDQTIRLQSKEEIDVCTVSSEEFHEKEILREEDTEIPDLRVQLRRLNDQQSEKLTRQYANDAFRLVSRIHISNLRITRQSEKWKSELKHLVDQRLVEELRRMSRYMSGIRKEFETLLSEGVQKSKESSLQNAMKEVINPKNKSHQTLRAVCRGQGFSRSKTGNVTDMNASLAVFMHEAIHDKFEEIFTTERTERSIYVKIGAFNIVPEKSILDEHQNHIKTEQWKVKEKLQDDVVQKKKKIYDSLEYSIRKTMLPAYEEAAKETGRGTLKRMQYVFQNHIKSSKDTMFHDAQKEMLKQLDKLGTYIHKELNSELQGAVEQVLQTPIKLQRYLPDVTEQYNKMRRMCKKLKINPLQQIPESPQVPYSDKETSRQRQERGSQSSLTGAEFVVKHRSKLIQRVTTVMPIADDLLEKGMIHPEIYSKVQAESTCQEKMRLLYGPVQSGGEKTKTEFYNLLKKHEKSLVKDLDSSN